MPYFYYWNVAPAFGRWYVKPSQGPTQELSIGDLAKESFRWTSRIRSNANAWFDRSLSLRIRKPKGWERIRDLESKIDRLKQDANRRDVASDKPSFVDQDLTESLLTEDCQMVDDLLAELTDHDSLRTELKKSLEDSLYELAANDIAEYQRGSGWRITSDQ